MSSATGEPPSDSTTATTALATVGLTTTSAASTAPALAAEPGGVMTGRFAGPIVGLRHETPTCSGVTDQAGTFRYRDGEVVTFSVGGVGIGAAPAASRLTLANIVARVDGNPAKLADPGLTNITRLLLTLDQGGDTGDGITITPKVKELVSDRLIDFQYRIMTLGPALADPLQAFAQDRVIVQLLDDLNRAGG